MNSSHDVIVEQYIAGLAEWSARSPFVYDVAMPSDALFAIEADEVVDELMIDDVYELGRITEPGDVWVDAGSHIGLFSIAAMQAGAEVACLIDMDTELARCAWHNASGFQRQSAMRGKLPSPGVTPAVLTEEIRTADRLYEASMMPVTFWQGRKRSCLKMDIQGAESVVLANGGAKRLADAYDLLVMEWHHRDDIASMLEGGGWQVDRIKAHVDVLLDIETSIIWATSG